MKRIIERGEAHYETHAPFARTYEWHPAYVFLERAKEVTLTSTIYRGDADRSAFIHDIRERERRVPYEDIHPWRRDTRARAEQHRQDEAAYAKDSYLALQRRYVG